MEGSPQTQQAFWLPSLIVSGSCRGDMRKRDEERFTKREDAGVGADDWEGGEVLLETSRCCFDDRTSSRAGVAGAGRRESGRRAACRPPVHLLPWKEPDNPLETSTSPCNALPPPAVPPPLSHFPHTSTSRLHLPPSTASLDALEQRRPDRSSRQTPRPVTATSETHSSFFACKSFSLPPSQERRARSDTLSPVDGAYMGSGEGTVCNGKAMDGEDGRAEVDDALSLTKRLQTSARTAVSCTGE